MGDNNSFQNFSLSNFDANITTDGSEELITIPIWCEIIMVVFLYITAILAVCGNCIILLVETKNRYKTSTDWLVTFMSCTDILFAVFPVPMEIASHMGYFPQIASDVVCKVFRFVEYFTPFSSALLLGLVAIDRYFKTCRPHEQLLTPARALRCCIGITAAAVVLNSSTFVIVTYEGGDECAFRQLAGGIWINSLMTVFISSYVFMFVAVSFCYIRVAYTIRTKLYNHSTGAVGAGAATPNGNTTETSGGNENAKTNFISTILHKSNKVAPLGNTGGNESSKGSKSLTAIKEFTLEGIRLFDQSSDGANDKNLNQKGKKGVYSTSSPNAPTCVSQAPQNPPSYVKHRYDTRVDRTTKIMFAVTMVFILTWIPTWCSFIYRSIFTQTFAGEVITFFMRKTYVVNTFMNPIFYIWMSSAFKEKTRQTLRIMCSRCRKIG